MVRFQLPVLSEIHPPKPLFYNSNSETLRRCVSLLSSVSSPNQLLQIHAQLIVSGHHRNSYITDKIVQFCTSDSLRKKHSIDLINHGRYAVKLSGNLETFSWNNVIRAYATSHFDSQREALSVFLDMRRLGVGPNEHTFPFLFKACASLLGLNEGRQIHGDVVKHGFLSNVYVQNTLIHLYGSCKKVLDSYKVFDEMTYRTVVSWNSIISANVECSWFYDSVELFVKMRDSGFEPDETTMVIVLSACAELGNLSLGKWIHSQVLEKGMVVNCQLGTALVDMYGKCGDVNYANLVFNRMVYRNVWTWSAMILGFAQHGAARYALDLFKEMRNYSIKPNHVTFLGVLCACSHAGLVEDGKRYFEEMEQVHGIKPMMVHFGAMVDILGRAGRLQEAYAFVMNMPIEADGIVWRALLSACSIHDVNDYSRVGEKVRQRLIELEPKRSGNFVMLANNYSEVGLWEKAADLRSRMRERGLKKIAGESCLELGGSIFRFFSGDSSSIHCADIFLLLNTLNLHAKMIKYG
ncbi:pentatricopeptide repeat-containing protein At2g36730 isoform X1 [Sesamum indicum]|uniref:Pentatricopeptide repeat-containing protein At2g36730 isoform X1 n=1 Tax=Sesamum indicum TaxID=4182 RepID=A0A8M8VE47_SESIN|nr:pentatricopeptide repeat-containing protein At2g36730 isoform X1 [Sesamum indicum]